jgi:hypothetical protein
LPDESLFFEESFETQKRLTEKKTKRNKKQWPESHNEDEKTPENTELQKFPLLYKAETPEDLKKWT